VTDDLRDGARRKRWNTGLILKVAFAVQCALALLVVSSDFPAGTIDRLLPAGPRTPSTAVPVAPGDQTRRFEPRRLPSQGPTGPGFPSGGSVTPRLEFSMAEVGGRAGTVILSGAIEDGDAQRLRNWLMASAEPAAAFALHSPGGAVHEAMEIGRMIRATQLPVVVAAGAACFSACPYILAGGEKREVSRTAMVGVHQHYFGENTFLPAFLLVSDIQAGQGEVMTYLAEMGIDPLMMAKALMTPPDDIYVLLPAELEEFRLATKLID
jgi:hypothetical protein